MQNLGFTRSANRHDHLLQTPDTFVRAPLPGMADATAIVHIGPARGAGFVQYTVEFSAGGSFESGPAQTFIYVLEGEVTVTLDDGEFKLASSHYAYIPADGNASVTADRPARAAFFEKPYAVTAVPAPVFFTGSEAAVSPTPLPGEPDIEVRTLFPADPSYDFAVNTVTYPIGACLPMVEIHLMEHGLLMLEGEGIYRLGEHWYPVKAGDFIWMAPYCPQWFGALGKTPSKYLIYKDWNRHPLDLE
ncbi:MAG TPA: (S)-ureidoglycine aminohydrolase [Bryobacteraceae bacterium]|jgi:(S)-ureidoglycine aminohydrolase|nr:(S)-ureidoglycine aminohydrolase [Bryobacteraceae bacterium]